MAFEALCKTKQANQTVVLYNYWYSQRNQVSGPCRGMAWRAVFIFINEQGRAPVSHRNISITKKQGRVVDGAGLSWVVETLLAAGRLDMAIDVFRCVRVCMHACMSRPCSLFLPTF